MIDINELREIAKSAGYITRLSGQGWYSQDDLKNYLDDDLGFDAKFIAAVNPAAISELLDRLEAAERKVEMLNSLLDAKRRDHAVVQEQNSELRAKIEAMEKQEPVKHEFQGRDGTWHPFIDRWHYENTVADGTWSIRSLYALPGAQGEEK